MSALSFCFESNTVRILGDALTPLFVAIDICKALGHSNPRQALRDCVDPEDLCKEFVETKGGRQEVNCVNESGMYALIFGSKLPSAKRFKKWVTSEVLPAIRKNGAYNVEQPSTLTPAQQLLVRQAVASRAKTESKHYQTIYRAIYNRFQIARYDQLHQSDLNECLKFINEVDLRVPEAQKCEPEKALPTKPRVTYTVTADFLEKQRTFVYCIRYLFRDPLMQAMKVMQALDVPNANMLWDVVHDFNLAELESNLDRLGYPVKELECYKHLMRIKK